MSKTGIVKHIRGDKLLKKRIADLLVQYDMAFMKHTVDIEDVLMNGFRGYLSFIEDDLCRILDKRYSILINNEMFAALVAGLPKQQWSDDPNYDKIRINLVKSIEEIRNDIFEKIALT